MSVETNGFRILATFFGPNTIMANWQSFIIDKICYFLEKYVSDIFYASVSIYGPTQNVEPWSILNNLSFLHLRNCKNLTSDYALSNFWRPCSDFIYRFHFFIENCAKYLILSSVFYTLKVDFLKKESLVSAYFETMPDLNTITEIYTWQNCN